MVQKSGVVIGAGGHALVCIEVLRAMGLDVLGCVSEDGSAAADLSALDVDMLGTTAELADLLSDERWAFVAVGDNAARRELVEIITSHGAELTPAISPSAIVSPSATIAAGALVMPGVIVNAQARIGVGAIVNTGARVDHECSIGSFAHVAPGTTLAGAVSVGEESLIGVGSTVLPGVSIGARAVVGAGAVVTTDVGAGSTVIGVPARPTTPPAEDARPATGAAADEGSATEAAQAMPHQPAPDQSPPTVTKVVVVCTGNLNRSPVAEVLLRRGLGEIGVEAEVTSAGLAAPTGARVDNKLRRLAGELGIGDEIELHRSVQLTPGRLGEADLVIAMTREHLDELERFGADPARAVTLRTAAWRSRVIGHQDLSFDEWVHRLTAPLPDSAHANGAGVEDIADPIGGRMRQYRAMGAEVNELVGTLVSHWGGR